MSTGLYYLENLLLPPPVAVVAAPAAPAATVFDGSDDNDLGAGFTGDLRVGSHSDTGPG